MARQQNRPWPLTTGRTFEQTNRSPFQLVDPPGPNSGGVGRARKYTYERLSQVSIRHSYYNRSEFRCPDFEVLTTPGSAALMRSLGLVLRREPTGFSVLYDQEQTEALESFLRRQPRPEDPCGPFEPGEEPEYWTLLSFVLALDNPEFLNFTDLPLDFNPTVRNLYFTNQQAHEEPPLDEVLLNPGRFVSTENPEQEVLRVVPVSFGVPIGPEVEQVEVLAISGEVVQCRKRCIPLGLAEAVGDPSRLDCGTVDDYLAGPRDDENDPFELLCTDVIQLDFSRLPEGRYVIELVRSTEPERESFSVLYTTAEPIPLAFVDLLFSRPDPRVEGGIYPVQDLCPPDATAIVPVHYHLDFRRRATLWSYYIVPQPQTDTFEDLRIVQVVGEPGCLAELEVSFAGPTEVVMANGQRAYNFESREPIPLQQQSTFCFQLWGRKGLAARDGLLVDRLPVAATDRLDSIRPATGPEPGGGSVGLSDIFVYL